MFQRKSNSANSEIMKSKMTGLLCFHDYDEFVLPYRICNRLICGILLGVVLYSANNIADVEKILYVIICTRIRNSFIRAVVEVLF